MEDPIWGAYLTEKKQQCPDGYSWCSVDKKCKKEVKEADMSDISFSGDEDVHDLAKIEPHELDDIEGHDVDVLRDDIIKQIEDIDDIDLLNKIDELLSDQEMDDDIDIAPITDEPDTEGFPGDR